MNEQSNIFRRESGANMHATKNIWYSFYETGQTISSGRYYCLTEEVKNGTKGPYILISISSCEGDKCNSKEQPHFMVAITNQLDYLYLKHVGFRHIHDYKEYMEERVLPMMAESQYNILLRDSNATIQDWMTVITNILERHPAGNGNTDDEALLCFLKPVPVIKMDDDKKELLQTYISDLENVKLDDPENSAKIADARMYLTNYLKDRINRFLHKGTGMVYG